jgi:cysteinyl-tRNA synthetase
MKLYNTLTRSIEELNLPKDRPVRLYTCGPTVYNYAHIGNLFSYISADTLYRTLKFLGYDVNWVMNLTDIDDKTMKGAIAEHGDAATVSDLQAWTKKYADEFKKDLVSINVLSSVDDPKITFINVTDKIAAIQEFVLKLIEKGYAYKADDGSTYFSIEKYQTDFGDYGALVGKGFMEGKQVGARIKNDEYSKDDLSDFVLWKAHQPDEAQIFWDHPVLGRGRPGWHIECSVINHEAFDHHSTDIHTGGVDLIFPHHTNEIAQSQPLVNPFCHYWLHSEHVLVDGKKMAKRDNNFFTVPDLAAKGFSGADLRYTFMQGHYRKQQNFSLESITAAQTARARLQHHTATTLLALPFDTVSHDTPVAQKIAELMGNDLNTAQTLALFNETMKDGNSSESDKQKAFTLFNEVLGLYSPADIQTHTSYSASEQTEIAGLPENIQTLVAERQAARQEKNFAESDRLRDELTKFGYKVVDTPTGEQQLFIL